MNNKKLVSVTNTTQASAISESTAVHMQNANLTTIISLENQK